MKNSYTNFKNKALILLLIFIAITQINAQQLNYSFANLQNTNDGTNDYYEVDVMVSADTDFKLGSGQLYINYNTLAFGDNIVANNNIEYTQPTGYILGEVYGFPAYKDFVKNDNTISRVSLSFQQGVSSGTISSNNVTSTPKKLFHIKIKYLDNTKNPTIGFETGSLFVGQTFTACGPTTSGFPDCTNNPGTQLTSDSFDDSGAILGLKDEVMKGLLLYPNPVKDILSINATTTVIEQVEIYSVLGKKVKEINADFNKVNINNLPTGVYVVKIYSEKGITAKKLIKN